jgi:uncharacterized protein YqiB (DUF1249 family)
MNSKYVPDLAKQMAICEANFARLEKLLPNLDDCMQCDIFVDVAGVQSKVMIEVCERFKFTTSLRVSQCVIGDQIGTELQQLLTPQLQVRMYHDARMAEVVSLAHQSQLKGKYTYPNKDMHQVDEKLQLNEYLAQWLTHCINHGYKSQDTLLQSLRA